MIRVLIFVAVLATLGVVVRGWLLRQGMEGRALFGLFLLGIAMCTYGYALYGACRGAVNFVTNPFACSRTDPIAFNPGAYRISRAR